MCLKMFYNIIPFPQVAGGRNLPAAVRKVAKASIEHSRHMKYQPLNEYRKRFRMKPYESFEELTGQKEFLDLLKSSEGLMQTTEKLEADWGKG